MYFLLYKDKKKEKRMGRLLETLIYRGQQLPSVLKELTEAGGHGDEVTSVSMTTPFLDIVLSCAVFT